MSTILVCTIMRDLVKHPNWEACGGSPLKAYFEQAENLERMMSRLGHHIRFSIFENDSIDQTPQMVRDWLDAKPGRGTLESTVLGMPRFRSLPAQNVPERIEGLVSYRNRVLKSYDGEDWVLFLEADILYHEEALHYLLSGSLGHIRSPLSFSHPHDLTSFYDPLSTRDLEGNKYRWAWPPPPNEKDMMLCIRGLPMEASTAFNCFCLVRGKIIADGVQFSYREGESEASAFCGDARGKGYRVFVYPSIRYSIIHPLADHAWNESMP